MQRRKNPQRSRRSTKPGLPDGHQIRPGQRESALNIVMKLRPADDIVGADVVIDAESRTAAIDGYQIGEGVVHAFGLGNRLPAALSLFFGVGPVNTVMEAVAGGK